MNMPVLENRIGKYEKDDNTVVLHINHCMDNSFYFCGQLKKVFCEVVFIAVPYNNKDVGEDIDYPCYHAEKIDGAYIIKKNRQTIRRLEADFLNVTYALIELALDDEITKYAEQGKKVIIIEDGGYHHEIIKAVMERNGVLSEAILGAVEQTTAGTRKSYCNGNYPVLSVARSVYKTRIESYFIANTVIRDICRMLHSIDVFLDFKHIYIFGYGIIGRPIAQKCASHNTAVHVYDTDNEILNAAEKDGHQTERNAFNFHNGAIIIGCAGEPSFTEKMLTVFQSGTANKIYLASASSKQIEFSAILDKIKPYEKWRTRYCAGYVFPNGKEIILLADGCPVNFFDEDVESLTYGMIDIVFTEMLMLSMYLGKQRGSLESKTYLLSGSPLIDQNVREDELINLWCEAHNLAFQMDSFNVHPLESKLKMSTKCK